MNTDKIERQMIFEKFGGRCAYCGCELKKGWHIDHKEPIQRRWKYVQVESSLYKKRIEDGCDNPERDNVENCIPACASCNIQKSSLSVEAFREKISNFINSLNSYHNQYKFAKRYGLVEETNKPVVFYFEITPSNTKPTTNEQR